MTDHWFDPVHVLGTTPDAAARLLEGRRVTPGEVEALASIYYDWREHLRDPHSYWVTVGQAARILRQSPVVVKQLVDGGRLPHVRHESGVPLMRRHEIEDRARNSGRRRRPDATDPQDNAGGLAPSTATAPSAKRAATDPATPGQPHAW